MDVSEKAFASSCYISGCRHSFNLCTSSLRQHQVYELPPAHTTVSHSVSNPLTFIDSSPAESSLSTLFDAFLTCRRVLCALLAIVLRSWDGQKVELDGGRLWPELGDPADVAQRDHVNR